MNSGKWFKLGIAALILTLLILSAKKPPSFKKPSPFPLSGDTLTCLIIPMDILGRNQFSVGYHYRVLQEFAQEKDCVLRLVTLPDSVFHWDALINKEVDVIINSDRDSVPTMFEGYFVLSPSVNNMNHVWVLHRENYKIMEAMYTWFSSFRHTDQYAAIAASFFPENRSRAIHLLRGNLSPYDPIIQRYSKEIGWDWRLIAALIYQESNFRMNVLSPKGAIGLMQVKDDIAHKYEMDARLLYDPEYNIRAGSLWLRDLGRQLCDSLLKEEEWIKFVLASYNAGLERIKDCRSFALSQNKNPDLWDEVVSVIPLMSDEAHFQGEHIRLGSFGGRETIRYVEEILERYRYYCEFLR